MISVSWFTAKKVKEGAWQRERGMVDCSSRWRCKWAHQRKKVRKIAWHARPLVIDWFLSVVATEPRRWNKRLLINNWITPWYYDCCNAPVHRIARGTYNPFAVDDRLDLVRLQAGAPTLWGYGEIGKHSRLKICRLNRLVGSIPTFPTNVLGVLFQDNKCFTDCANWNNRCLLDSSQAARQLAVNSHSVGAIPTCPANFVIVMGS